MRWVSKLCTNTRFWFIIMVGQVRKLCANTRFWILMMVVRHRCQIQFLALAGTCSSAFSCCQLCGLLSPSLPPKLLQPEDIMFFINLAPFDWDELGNNYWSRSAGKTEKVIQFYQLDRAKQGEAGSEVTASCIGMLECGRQCAPACTSCCKV